MLFRSTLSPMSLNLISLSVGMMAGLATVMLCGYHVLTLKSRAWMYGGRPLSTAFWVSVPLAMMILRPRGRVF